MTTKQFIEKAIEGGWRYEAWWVEGVDTPEGHLKKLLEDYKAPDFEVYFLDPAACIR